MQKRWPFHTFRKLTSCLLCLPKKKRFFVVHIRLQQKQKDSRLFRLITITLYKLKDKKRISLLNFCVCSGEGNFSSRFIKLELITRQVIVTSQSVSTYETHPRIFERIKTLVEVVLPNFG